MKDDAIREADLVLLSSEPFPFKARHLDELRAVADCSGKRLALMDGTMTGWYSSRAIEALGYLRELARKLSGEAR